MKPESACARYLDELMARGKPSPELTAHLAGCPDCRGVADTVKDLRKRPSAYPEGAFTSLKEKVLASCLPVAVAAGAGAAAGSTASGGAAGLSKAIATLLIPFAVVAGLAYVAFHPAAPVAPPPPSQTGVQGKVPAAASGTAVQAASQAAPVGQVVPRLGKEGGEGVMSSDQE